MSEKLIHRPQRGVSVAGDLNPKPSVWHQNIGVLWPGFAINTIFYAAILWLPVAGLGALRRRRRIRHGLCPACAYPVGTNPHCTECGTKLASRIKR